DVCDFVFFFLVTDTATTEVYTLSLHDALPICRRVLGELRMLGEELRQRDLLLLQLLVRPLLLGVEELLGHAGLLRPAARRLQEEDRKSTRLNSSHDQISYAVFCLKKKKQHRTS